MRLLAVLALILVWTGLPAHAQTTLRLDASKITGERLPLIDTDTLLYVENRGFDRIFLDISGHRFRLVADTSEVDRSANAFPIPRVGDLTIDIAPLIAPGDDNYVQVAAQGAGDTEASRIIIAPVFVNGQTETAYRIPGLETIPERFGLTVYPNPFRDAVTLQFRVPAARLNGVDVEIALYDVLGRRVAVPMTGRRYFPGTFDVAWSPPTLAPGLYFARIVAGNATETVRVVHIQ